MNTSQSDDEEPDKICQSCINELSRSYSFIEMCKGNDLLITQQKPRGSKLRVPSSVRKPKSLPAKEVDPFEIQYLEIQTEPKDDDVNEDIKPFSKGQTISFVNIETLSTDDKPSTVEGSTKNDDSGDENPMDEDEIYEPRAIKVEVKPSSSFLTEAIKPVWCQQCESTFKTNSSLKIHNEMHIKKLREQKNPVCQCHICEKILANFNTFKEHLELHYGDNMYRCAVCGQGFKTKYRYQAHMISHDPDCPLVCMFCDKKFVKRSGLENHLKGKI